MPDTSKSRFSVLIALFLAVVGWSLFQVTSQTRFPFGNDAIGYMVDAANILSDKGIVRIPNETEQPDLDYAPTAFHPPGFGLAIAGVAALGFTVEQAAIAISTFCWVALPFALFFTLRPILPPTWCAAVTALVVLSPSVYLHGSTINTDVPTLLLSVLAIGLAFRGIGDPPRVGFLFLAGLATGLAYALRNSVMALYVAMFASLVTAAVLRVIPISVSVRSLTWFILGSAAPIGLLLLRNHLVFGSLQPYVLLVGEHATLREALGVYFHGLIWDIVGSSSIGSDIAWNIKALLAVTIPTAVILAWAWARHWRAASLQARFTALFGTLYAFAGASMLIIAYILHGLDPGYLLRHMMQYVWLLLAITIVVLHTTSKRAIRVMAALAVLALLSSRIWFIADDLRSETQMKEAFTRNNDVTKAAQPFLDNSRILTDQIKWALVRDGEIPAKLSQLPAEALIISNQGQILSLISGRAVRTVSIPSQTDLAPVIDRVRQVVQSTQRHRPVYLAIVPDNRSVHTPDASEWKQRLVRQLPKEYQIVGEGVNLIIFGSPRLSSPN